MKTLGIEIHNPSDMRCSGCHLPFEISVDITPEGKRETYLQCWGCKNFIKLHDVDQEQPKLETVL